ncbi:MAG: ABC transporter permease [Aigarchaeota archaeon]|nr:ABC transporter permease [Aigarchaeota archaeon]MDW7986598.1 ABC transporter permease [Nitrososphaerota archaeon]
MKIESYSQPVFKSILQGLFALMNRELKKWIKEPIILLMAVLQPIMWMVLFGKSMNIGAIFSANTFKNINLPDLKIPGELVNPPIDGLITIPGSILSENIENLLSIIGGQALENVFGISDYFSYLAVGMISMITIFTSTFSGMSIVWDRRLGFLYKVLSTPVPRPAILFSKVLNAAIRSIFQSTIVFGLAILLGVRFSPSFSLINLLGIYLAIFLFSIGLSSLFVALALRSTRHETQIAVVNLTTMPLMFTSNAFFPTSLMPDWLQTIAKINPVSYMTDALRQLTIYSMDVPILLLDFTYLALFATSLSVLGMTLAWRFLVR